MRQFMVSLKTLSLRYFTNLSLMFYRINFMMSYKYCNPYDVLQILLRLASNICLKNKNKNY